MTGETVDLNRYTFPKLEDRKARKSTIKHFVRQAHMRRTLALMKAPASTSQYLGVAEQALKDDQLNSVLTNARGSLRYAKSRALLGISQGGNPWDPSAVSEWKHLQQGLGLPEDSSAKKYFDRLFEVPKYVPAS